MDINKFDVFAPSTGCLIGVLNYKLNHKTTDAKEKNIINKYINDIYNRSVKILNETPDQIYKPLEFEKEDMKYFIEILDLYIKEDWNKIDQNNDIEVEFVLFSA